MRESGEDYLETILLLKDKKNFVRSVDIATALDFSRASVSRAVKKLSEDGYVKMCDDGEIVLTEKGYAKASGVYERHRVLTSLFEKFFGVDPEIASDDACRIEHVLSEESFQKIKKFMIDIL